ncbi:MAG: chromosome segregation protein SMC [Anaerolineaceae bacterium]|nr:MAG: chromosome segregation protein SMC [Anaerolineaceae bacterium]
MDRFDTLATRLKSLELQGYKTFASKTPFVFAPTITAIVGPNGSGKSNIADSIRWVLGEQSYSLLRGKRTEDMIFSGSETRPRASMAAATITFDNSDGWLPIDFTEVTVSRRAYRDGQNEYILNGQRVRLRDVQELLATCGLAQRTYNIVGQGLVDAALSLKAEERRRLFEEAAGIGLYRTRREEALRRLDATRRNLERVRDILAELRPRLRSLERQAKRAEAYTQVRNDLQEALQVYYGYHWYHLLEKVKSSREEIERRTLLRDKLQEKQTAAEELLTTTRRRIDDLRSQLHAHSQQVTSLYGEREVRGKQLAVAQERLRWLGEQESLTRSEVASLEEEHSGIIKKLTEVREEGETIRHELTGAEAARQQLFDTGAIETTNRENLLDRARQIRKSLEAIVAEQAAGLTKVAQLRERLGTLETKQAEYDLEVNKAVADVAKARDEEHSAQMIYEKAVRERLDAENKEKTLRERLSQLVETHNRHSSQLSELNARRAGYAAQLELLGEQSDGLDRIVERLTNAIQDGRLKGWVGRLEENLEVPSQFRTAITAALGDFSKGLAFRSFESMLGALEFLDGSEGGEQVAFLPLSSPRNAPPLNPHSDPDCLGIASQLVNVSKNYRSAVDLLLGRTLVVTDRDVAKRLLPEVPLDARLVTLKGDLYYPTGQVLIRRGSQGDTRRETRQFVEGSLNKVIEAIKRAKLDEKQRVGEIGGIKTELDEVLRLLPTVRLSEQDGRLNLEQANLRVITAEEHRVQVEERKREVEEEYHQLEAKLIEQEERTKLITSKRSQLDNELQNVISMVERAEPDVEMARLDARLEVARRAADEVDSRITELEERLGSVSNDRKSWADRLDANLAEQTQLRAEVEEGELAMRSIEDQLADLSERMGPIEGELEGSVTSLSAIEEEEGQARESFQLSERERSHLQIELARREEELISLRRRIEDDFGLVTFNDYPDTPDQEPLPFEGLVKELTRVDEMPLELETQVNQLRAQLRRMGAVNPEAQREYIEVNERSEFLTAQMDDLRQAEKQMQQVIAELDLLMEREFIKTFDAVAEAFGAAFTRLFGGGSAHLVLTDPEDLTQTGIDIEARLPGRRSQGLAVLSGGERSLTACALIFALLQVSPPPFCVLDEVDAMLDDANVIRYIQMLRELSEKTQFVLITHNRLTVQAAEVVYGISMGADSASRSISLKLDEVEEMVTA